MGLVHAVLFQVMVNNKYLGYFFSILLIYVWGIILSFMEVNSNMLTDCRPPRNHL